MYNCEYKTTLPEGLKAEDLYASGDNRICITNKDMVNHPDHYKSAKGIEVIDVVEAFTDGLNGIEATDTGNIIKYICRWKKKNGVEDLEKIRWYVDHLINHVKNQ